MSCSVIACTYQKRLWCWDFLEKKTMCATDKIVVILQGIQGITMVTEPRPPSMGEFRIGEFVKHETKETDNA